MSSSPNILLIVIDGFRADRCFGDKKTSITPNLDKLIENGIYFDKTISSATMTFPSITSLITSKYPFECLLDDKGLLIPHPDVINYFEKFFKKGYHIYSNNPKLIKHLQLENICTCIAKEYEDSKALSKKLGQTILEQIKSIQEPWLFYLHLYDLHDAEFFKIIKTNDFLSDEKFGSNKYERMVSTMDVWLGKIFDELDLTNTLIVLTSDHGTVRGALDIQTEDFYEKLVVMKSKERVYEKTIEKIPKKFLSRYVANGVKKFINLKNVDLDEIQSRKSSEYDQRILNYLVNPIDNLYDDKLVVPLIFSGLNLPKDKIIHEQVQSIDLFPTVAEILDFPDMNHDIRGRSLLSQIKNDDVKEIPAFIECLTNSTKIPRKDVIGIRTSEFKYFRNRNDAKKDVHLFNLKKDPLEENNIQENNPDMVKEMEKILLEFQDEKEFFYDKGNNLTEKETKEVEEELKKLGYI